MATELCIPSVGMSMTEGTLTEWLVENGAQVEKGDLLYTMESDKSVQEIESPVSGVLEQIGVEGETYEVGTLIGKIL
jgi:pyruvate/2-oxoglutarate dehydrogenase complex dihydrolipoamide acyltransferase (E2) component